MIMITTIEQRTGYGRLAFIHSRQYEMYLSVKVLSVLAAWLPTLRTHVVAPDPGPAP